MAFTEIKFNRFAIGAIFLLGVSMVFSQDEHINELQWDTWSSQNELAYFDNFKPVEISIDNAIGRFNDADDSLYDGALTDNNKIIYVDTDGDGIDDAVDEDDDNDGILDADECLITIGLATNGDFSNWIFASGWSGSGRQWNMSQNRAWYPPWNGTGTAIFSQTISVSANTENTITFDLGANANNPGDATFTVKIDGVTQYTETSSAIVAANGGNAAQNNATQNMAQRTVTFTPTTNAVSLSFEGFSTSGWHDTMYVDNVVVISGCTDFDGDGVPNVLDLDSDNDGIYDAIEAMHGVASTNGKLTGSVGLDGVPDAVQATGQENSGTINYTIQNSDGADNADFVAADSDGDGCPDVVEAGFTESTAVSNELQGNGYDLLTGLVIGIIDGYTTPGDFNSNTLYDYVEVGSAPIINTHPQDQGVGPGADALFSVTATGGGLLYQWQVSTDDGFSFTSIAGETSSSLLVASVTTNEDNNRYRVLVTDLSFACNPSSSNVALLKLVSDFDNDGVVDSIDLDDDNDGIYDEIEATNCTPGANDIDIIIFNDNFGLASGNRISTPYTNYGYEDGTGSAGADADLQDGEYTIFEDIEATASWASRDWQSIGDHTTGTDKMIIFNSDATAGLEFYRRTLVEVVANVPLDISFWVMNLDVDKPEYANRAEPDITAMIQQGGVTVFSFNTGSVAREADGDPNAWNEFMGSFTPTTNTALEFVLINNAPGGSGNDLAIDDITVSQAFCDSDGNGIPNAYQVDSDNDGCNDSDEAYGTITADADGNGFYGSGIPVVNPDGTVQGASYQVPVDGDANGSYDFAQPNVGNAIATEPIDENICVGCDGSINVVGSNVNTFQWQILDGSIWVNLTDSGIYSNTTTASLSISNPTPADNGNQYRVIVTDTAYVCASDISDAITLTVNVATIITNRSITYRVNRN